MFPWFYYPIVFSLLGLNVVSIYLLPTREYCRPFQCIENGLNLTYPFWPLTDLNRTVKTYCGYHGYGVNCSDGKPIITVSDHKYWVKTVNYSSSTFTAVDIELTDRTCGSGRNYSLNSWTSTRRDFYFGFETEFITLHRNCSSSPTSPPASSVLCQDSNPEKLSYFVSEDTDTDNRKFSCEENMEIPVLSEMATNLSNVSLPSVWQRGFQLSWSRYPVTECVSCRISGGRCGYVESYYSYICFCPSGTISFRQDCDADNRGDRKKVYIIVSVTLVASIIVSALAWILYRTKEKRSGKKKKILEMFTSDKTSVDRREFPLLLEDQARASEGQELPLFEFNVIEIATDKFTNKLGEGGFGPVYKGKLVDGQEIAVKRLSRSSGQGIEEFKNELKLISKLQHRNLVRLLGFCIEKEEKMLVYEYMPHRSLDAFIFDPIRKSVLDWGKRFNIVDGIARGLLYLHRDSRLRIIHRDLKASNILLDEDMNPKISDFGMARMFGGNQISASTNRVVGTYGYMSPEYAMEGLFSEKSDVFSFGVLLLEVLSSERNTSFYRSEESLNLLGYAWRLWNEGKAIEFIDPTLVDPYLASELTRCIHVGLLCVQERAIDRPTMSAIVFMLGSDAILPTPKQPAFILDKQLHSDMAQILGSVSLNSITLTSVGGR